MSDPERNHSWLPLPTAHFMALAPLDVWVRVLFFPLAYIHPRYFLRLGWYLVSSTLATILTLPERIAVGLWMWFTPGQPQKMPGPVIVLGYYRSGTTHLQNLLACDPKLYSPRWIHALVPQGFVISWAFFRLFMIPFMSATRPMDEVEVGPEFPAEDQFGVNNWSAACPLIGKSLLPRLHGFYNRFHTLRHLTPSELNRWRDSQWGFVRKVAMVAGARRLVLKSPSHTAHVEELLEMFREVPDVKFIHISRDPQKVLQSNVRMHLAFQTVWNLQDGLPQTELENQLVEEYVETELDYLRVREKIPAEQLVELRIQDLRADPIGQLKELYAKLDLEFTPEFEQQVLEYLHANKDYKPNRHPEWNEEQQQRLAPKLEPLVTNFHHDQPTREKQPLPELPPASAQQQQAQTKAAGLSAAVGVGCGLLWLLLSGWGAPEAIAQWNRLVWPTSLAIGYTSLAIAKRGNPFLGYWAGGVTLLVLLAVGLAQAGLYMPDSVSFWGGLMQSLVNFPTIFWTVVAWFTAYLLATRSNFL